MTMNRWIAPSILAADWTRLGEEVNAVTAAGCELIHIDIMDHHYVPNLTLGPQIVADLRRHGLMATIDCHLMASPVDDLVLAFARAGADWISIHPEATLHVDRTLALIREQGKKAGVALNPATPLCLLDHILDRLDYILVMTVNPGFGGQGLIEAALHKVAAVRRRIEASGRPIRLQVDGGINEHTIGEASRLGADTFVVGSAIFGHPPYDEAIARSRTAAGHA
jgi:ribulose-phosphate 3-epimerase